MVGHHSEPRRAVLNIELIGTTASSKSNLHVPCAQGRISGFGRCSPRLLAGARARFHAPGSISKQCVCSSETAGSTGTLTHKLYRVLPGFLTIMQNPLYYIKYRRRSMTQARLAERGR